MAARGQNHRKGKNKLAYAPKPKTPPPPKREDPAKDLICHECGKTRHWKRNCPQYLAELLKKKKNAASRAGGQGLRESRKQKPGALSLYVGNGEREAVEAIEVENQLGKTIKSLSSDHGGEYMSQEFLDQLKDHRIIAHPAPPYTLQHNGVSERRNKTLLDMGCEELIKRDTLTKPNKLEPKSIKCIFIGYPKETIGYSFYYPPENKVLVARNAKFLVNSLITQEACGSLEDFEIIQEEDTHPSIDTILNHEEDDLELDEPQSDIIPIRRSTRIRHLTYHTCLYIDAEEHELGDLGELTNYKAALLDPDFDKWLNAINVEMQSMKDNEVWVLVELLPNGKTIGSKWLFKKKTDMDGAVHTYKARLVAKGYTRTTWIDYEETFSPVADIRTIRILIAITVYYDYEIWQMDVKTAFLNGYLSKEVYMEQLEGFVNPKYPDRRYHIENSKRRSIAMQENLRLSKSQGASAPTELKRMQNVPYASANPGDLHWTTVKNNLKYLKTTKDMFLVYEGDTKRELRVSCYTDAGYLTDADDLKSQTGYVFFLNGGAVDWKSAKPRIFATLSAEAEYIAAFNASKEAVWVRKFIFELGVVPTIEEPISMYCDNTGAIAIANKSKITKGARHFLAKVHYLREVIEYGDVKLEKVHTVDNLAGPFTKALAFPKHSEHTRNIRMLPASSLM
nr:hypothetical protein [Tanacetum cinerariifolium]